MNFYLVTLPGTCDTGIGVAETILWVPPDHTKRNICTDRQMHIFGKDDVSPFTYSVNYEIGAISIGRHILENVDIISDLLAAAIFIRRAFAVPDKRVAVDYALQRLLLQQQKMNNIIKKINKIKRVIIMTIKIIRFIITSIARHHQNLLYLYQKRSLLNIVGWGGQRSFKQCSKTLHYWQRQTFFFTFPKLQTQLASAMFWHCWIF